MRLDSTNFFNEYMFHPFYNDLDTYGDKLLNLFFSAVCFAALPVFIYCYFTAKPVNGDDRAKIVNDMAMEYFEGMQGQPLPSAPELDVEYNEFPLEGFEQPVDSPRYVNAGKEYTINPDDSISIFLEE